MKIFYRTALSRRDFHEACEFLQALPGATNKVTRYSLITAAIIAYSRPFSGNEKDPNAEADRTLHLDPTTILSDSQLLLHNEILRLRNKLVAHAEFAESPVRLLDSQPDGMTLHGPYIETNGRYYDLRDFLLEIDMAAFTRIADLFAAQCQNEMFKLKDQEART